MTQYHEIIADLKLTNPAQAEFMQEEIDIIIHKLKFLPRENFPRTIILDQADSFKPVYSDLLAEKIQICGGQYIHSLAEDPEVIMILQGSDSLFSEITDLLNQEAIRCSKAYAENRIYIIQNRAFNLSKASFLADLEILAEIMQPKYFVYNRQGEDWIQFEIQ